jgi:hypothetical protein
MEQTDEQYLAEAKEAGIDVEAIVPTPPEAQKPSKESEEAEEEVENEEQIVEEPTDTDTEDEDLPKEPPQPKKRTIYHDLKDEKNRRKDAERERDDLKAKLDALSNADTPVERQDAKDELEAFAEKNNLDPQTLKEMRAIFTKDVSPKSDEEREKALSDLLATKQSLDKIVEKQHFEDEFKTIVPTLKTYFPTIGDAELQGVKDELDKLAHSKEWHDKDLDYVLFKNRDKLEKLVSPRKRTLESNTKRDIPATVPEFNPTPDFAKMSAQELEQWEKDYSQSSSEKMTNSRGIRVL